MVWRAVFAVGLAFVAGCSSPDRDEFTAINETSATPAASALPTTEPSTTADPVAVAEEAAVAAVMEQGRLWRECVRDIPACDPSVLTATSTGEVYDNLVARLSSWQEKGYERRPPLDPVNSSNEVVSVSLTSKRNSAAVVTTCQVDGAIIVQPGGAPDGSDLVVDDDVVSILADLSVRREGDGVWRVFRSEIVQRTAGGGGCTS